MKKLLNLKTMKETIVNYSGDQKEMEVCVVAIGDFWECLKK